MQKEAALAALRTIDVKVYASAHVELSPEQLGRLTAACEMLVSSVSDDPILSGKATALVKLIQTTLENPTHANSIREQILEQGISLTLFIQQQP